MPYAKGEVMNITVYLGASKGDGNESHYADHSDSQQ